MTLRHQRTRRRGAPALAIGLLLALGLAACGAAAPTDDGVVSLQSPSASPGASAAPSASVDPEDAMLAFEKCMKAHGVDVQVSIVGQGDDKGGVSVSGPQGITGPGKGQDPQPATGQPDVKAMEAADKACHDLLPRGTMGDPTATMDPALADKMLAFAKCMREHGVDFPDPQFNGGGVTMQVGGGSDGGGVDPTSKEFQAAQEACGKDLPGGAPFVVNGSSSGSQP